MRGFRGVHLSVDYTKPIGVKALTKHHSDCSVYQQNKQNGGDHANAYEGYRIAMLEIPLTIFGALSSKCGGKYATDDLQQGGAFFFVILITTHGFLSV